MEKAISSVVATVIMLAVTFTLATSTYLFLGEYASIATQGLEAVDYYCDMGSVTTTTLP